MSSIRYLFNKTVDFFRSQWFRIVLLCIMLVLCIISITINIHTDPQIEPSMETISFARWAYVIGMPNYGVLWGIMLCGILYWITMLSSVIPMIPRGRKEFSFSNEKQLVYLKKQFNLSHDLDLSAHHIKMELVKRGFLVREQQSGNEIYFSAEKHKIQVWAPMVIHIGIICMILGFAVVGVKGIREDVHTAVRSEGQLLSTPQMIGITDFNTDYYPETRHVRDYDATLAVTLQDKHTTTTMKVHAGNAAEYEGFRYHVVDFEQSLRDAIVEVRMKGRRERTRILRLTFGKDEHIRRTSWIVRLERFVPDFIIDAGRVISRSSEWNNPAVLVSVFKGRKFKFKKWLFEKYVYDPFFEKKENLFFKLNALNAGNFVKVRVSRMPGIYFVWLGMFIISIGLLIICLFSYRAVWILIEGKGHQSAVLIAGESAREYIRFPEYFNRLVDLLGKV